MSQWEQVFQRHQEAESARREALREQILNHEAPDVECEYCHKPRKQYPLPDWEARIAGPVYDMANAAWYFKPEPHPDCDAALVRIARETRRQKHLEESYRSIHAVGLPKDYRSKTLESFVTDSADASKSVRLAKAWQLSDDSGLLFMGPSGSGKSHLLMGLLNRIVEEISNQEFEEIEARKDDDDFNIRYISGKRNVVYFTAAQFFNKLRADMSWQFEESISKVFFLDDLGAENTTDWGREILFRLFDYCASNKITVFISTNLNMNEMKERLHERIVSRIMQLCVPINLTGTDKRKEAMLKKAEELKRRAGIA